MRGVVKSEAAVSILCWERGGSSEEVWLDASILVNVQMYPIADLSCSAARALIQNSRNRLEEVGAVALSSFLTEEAVTALATEARRLDWAAHEYRADHTVYFEPSDETLSPDHPRRRLVHTHKGNVPYDRIPASALLRSLYRWDDLLHFIAAVLGEPVLYRHADAMAALNINTHGPGQQLGWHFDRTDFAVTLSLQQCEQGGVFEYVPNLRSSTEENFDRVARILSGAQEGVRRLPAEPGTLTLFRGHYSLHRVTPGDGPSKRLMAALSYVRDPEVTFSSYARKLFYGRETALEVPV